MAYFGTTQISISKLFQKVGEMMHPIGTFCVFGSKRVPNAHAVEQFDKFVLRQHRIHTSCTKYVFFLTFMIISVG